MNTIITTIFKNIFECPKKRQARELAKSEAEWNTNRFETYNKGDIMDYDGMGDWGRFPPIKK